MGAILKPDYLTLIVSSFFPQALLSPIKPLRDRPLQDLPHRPLLLTTSLSILLRQRPPLLNFHLRLRTISRLLPIRL